MTIDEIKKYIQDNLFTTTGRLSFKNLTDDIEKEIMNYTSYFDYTGTNHFSLRCFFILDGKTELPRCKECKNHYTITTKKQYEEQNFCSRKCSNINLEIKEKIIKSNIEKYGVEYATQKKETIEKQKKTNLEKYGVESVLQNKKIIEKKKQTTIERHGIESCFQNPIIQEKIKNQNLERYGVKYPLLSQEIKDKIKDTNIDRYGTPIPSQSHLHIDTINIINNKENFSEFIKDKSAYEISKKLGINQSSFYKITDRYGVQDLYQKRGPSYLELEMAAFLDELNINFEINDRTVLNGKELDFYIPTHNLAIEMNGLYWHNDSKNLDKNYHYNKWKNCFDKDIHLVSIFEDDWVNQKDKIHNIVKTHLGLKPKGIPARKTIIQEINVTLARPFLEKYHLQGFVGGKHYGAFDGSDLIAVMTFGHTRNQRFELSRFVMDNYNHPGLFSKLFKYAQKELQFDEVVSFSDNTCFTGNVYSKNGFDLVQIINSDYRYFYKGKRFHKSNFKKEQIKKKFPEIIELIDSGITEKKAMDLLGIPRVYDCGKCEWVWKTT